MTKPRKPKKDYVDHLATVFAWIIALSLLWALSRILLRLVH